MKKGNSNLKATAYLQGINKAGLQHLCRTPAFVLNVFHQLSNHLITAF